MRRAGRRGAEPLSVFVVWLAEGFPIETLKEGASVEGSTRNGPTKKSRPRSLAVRRGGSC